MSPRMILISSLVGFGALGLLWTAMAVRSEPAPVAAKPSARKKTAARTVPVDPASEATSAIPLEPTAPLAAPAPEGGADFRLIEERVRKMEEKLLALETKRTALTASNQELERKVAERNAEFLARNQAEWRVRSWEQLLGLTETQKAALTDLVTQWGRDDAGRQASRDVWLSRESELRSRLSVEQASRLQSTSTTQSLQMWSYLGRSIGSMVGATKEESTRFQQVLGDYRAPNAMLLPEAHGADWPGMMREGASRLETVLSTDQMAKLTRFIQR